MFCNQCEQTAKGEACTVKGVCGKDEDIQSLQLTLTYGLKGIAAYAYHAREYGVHDEAVDAFMHEALFKTLTNVDFDLNDHVKLVLKAGETNLRIMKLLDEATLNRFGTPSPSRVQTGRKAAPGILVSGHDFLDLEALLKQTEGTGIMVYTHGELLPAHAYPELRKYKHLAGNWGTAWQKQRTDFPEFGGPILMTTNCVMPPLDSYRDKLYTTSIVAVAGCKHVERADYSAVIEHAKKIGALPEKSGKPLMTGFHHSPVLALAPKIVDAVKAGKIRRFFLIGGCDGAKPGRDYYTRLAEIVPRDCLILTVACGKYRFNDRDFGDIDGIPRLLDLGQCNNSYSGILIAQALAEAFKCSVNELPLSIVLSWYEQKAVAILLTLLHLGVKNIRLGPSPPAFVTPKVLKVLQDNYNLMLIGEPGKDLEAMLAGH
ncbi:MAG: hydroxylamine reductase [Methanobacteriota archaeon]